MIPGGKPRILTLVRPLDRCTYAEARGLAWACTLHVHGPEVAHVLKATR